jgi:hypothetical protein
METLLKIGGVYFIALAIFHMGFWKIFKWDKELKKVSFLNRCVMQVLNLCLTFVFAVFAYISIVHSYDLIQTNLGRVILVSIAALLAFRAVLQVVYFKLSNPLSFGFLLFFIGGSLIYAVPIVIR